LLIPVAAWPKVWVCGHLLTGIAGSNPASDVHDCLSWCSVLSGRGLCFRLITCPDEPYWVWCLLL